MKNYIVYFELFGKKMKTNIKAENEEKAKEIIKSKIIFYKVEYDKSIDEHFNDVFNILDIKK